MTSEIKWVENQSWWAEKCGWKNNQPIIRKPTIGGWNIKVDGKTTNPSFLCNQPQPIEEGSNGWESDTDQGGKYQFPCKIII